VAVYLLRPMFIKARLGVVLASVGSVINSLLTKVVINMLLTDSKHRPCLEFVVINTRM